jgi:N-acetylglucosaminyldiphosphoundecaprenol N-acetyl-beta-D-mannosaminyltransferase
MNRCANVLGVSVHAVDMINAVSIIESAIAARRHGYVCVTGVHGVMEAQKDSQFRSILNHALLVTPDGTPMVWVGRFQGLRHMRRVFGPDLMIQLCERSVSMGYRHFLYGGEAGVAEALAQRLSARFPGVQIVGTYTPPFRPLTQNERTSVQQRIIAAKADIVWIGLSTPKQERFMADNWQHIPALLIGVGAAFDLHTGRIRDAPQWMKLAGLQWFHRLCQDPQRLWKRYLTNNPKFLWRISFQLLGLTNYDLD